ncbi:MAG TPA: hypothetical protein ENG73_11855 [Desulfobacterales bacterium]|nr:MAG: hypothetical protein DRH15_06750 [Deltaproteobacteria bacterium]HDG98841.1 hypothetical protein [Desulfobacterales bacterium]
MENSRLFQRFITLIAEIFDKKFSKTLMQAYWGALEDYTDEQCARAFEYLLKNSKYLPKPAHIIEAIHLTSPNQGITPCEARIQIEEWLYNGGPKPRDPLTQEIIRSYGGWERLGMTSYHDLKFLLRDIEERFEAICARRGIRSYLPEGQNPNQKFTTISNQDQPNFQSDTFL